MLRMKKIEEKLSMMESKGKHIMYLATEDRDILQHVFGEMANSLKVYIKDKKQRDHLQNVKSENFFQVVTTNHILEDAYDAFVLNGSSYIPNGKFRGWEDGHRHPLEGKIPSQGYPIFFMLNDFHIIEASKAAHFLKQFLMAAKEEEAYGRFVLLFLVSPMINIPKGFECEMEVIDVPEMEQEDIEEYLLEKAAEEYFVDVRRWQQEGIDPEVVKRRISQAARDCRGISRRGIDEIISDLRAEFGSFFGRAEDSSGIEENLDKIAKARKRMAVEFKKNEAKYDSTVTMKEPKQNAVEGLKEFFWWIDSVKEDFLDVEKAYESGNEPPKGVLLTGVPGSGKTQAAKEVAFRMGGFEGNVPLVQFRMDNLLGGHVGDSEANFKRCRKRIEALAPCIVLMDEIEKTFDTSNRNSNNDVKLNILTALLDWMQENKKQIFFFATSNSVASLKPELLRDGRFDMRFCVFMPTCDELVEIFRVHMENANRRAKGNLLGHFDYRQEARMFLEEITEYAKEKEKNMFYTGANVENLIAQANRLLKRKNGKRGREFPYSQREYHAALLEAAKGKYNQPYGMTNMKDIVNFWLSAYENKYTNAGSLDMFSFVAYNDETCEFEEAELPELINTYDMYMFEKISAEIRKSHKESKERKGKEPFKINE